MLERYSKLISLCNPTLVGSDIELTVPRGIKKRNEVMDLLKEDYNADISILDHNSTFQTDDDIPKKFIINRNLFREVFNANIYLTVDHFLDRNKEKLDNHIGVYIYESNPKDIISANDDIDVINHYNNYIKIKDLLIDISDSKKNSNEYLYFIDSANSCKIIFNRGYLIKETEKVEKILSFYNSYIEDNTYNEEFKIILKRVATDIIRRNQNVNIESIIKDFDDFYNELIKSYHIFLSKFSFEKIKNSFYEEKNKYLKTLNDDLSSSFKVVYSIPIGLGLTLILKFLDTSLFFETLAIFISYSLFLIISFVLLVHNFQSTIINKKVIKTQENLLKNGLNNDFIYNEDFIDTFKFFYKKIKLTRVLSIILCIILTILFCLFLVKVLIFNENISNFLKSILTYLENKKIMLWFVQTCRLLY